MAGSDGTASQYSGSEAGDGSNGEDADGRAFRRKQQLADRFSGPASLPDWLAPRSLVSGR